MSDIVKNHSISKSLDEVLQKRLLELLHCSPTSPVFIGPLVFFQKDVVAITTYESVHHLPDGLYRQYLQRAYENGKNVYEVNLSLAFASTLEPSPTVTTDLWERIWDPDRIQRKATYLFRFVRYAPDNDWFKLAAMARLKASVKVFVPKLVKVGRWLVAANNPMFGAIVAAEEGMKELLDRFNEKVNQEKEDSHE